ncbi:MAG TPA: hypothetical protein VLS25_00755, partial [Dehalococcoidia bacterium]|nr:hypothetical protein [Dehalococcoidia bacterium]
LNGPVDWNGDGDTADNPVTVNVDTVGANGRPSRCNNGSNNSTLTGHDDWSVIALNFRPFGDAADGAINPVLDPEMTLQEMLDLQQELNTTDLKISKVDSPDPVVAGGELYYDITVTNNGPNPANSVKVTDTLPTGLVFVTSTDTCVEAPAGTLTCNLGTVAANASKTFTIKTQVPANYIAATGPVGITNSATVENVGGTDSDPSNNSASASTIVEDSADLRVTKICKPDGPLLAGQTGTCTIFVDNLGPSDARNVVLTDANLSNGAFTITGANANPGGACPVASGVVTCNLGTEPAGGRTTITVTVTANDAVDINDCASVASDTPDPNTGNNQACESINVSAVADLQAFSVFGAEVQTNGLPGLTIDTNALPPMPDPACCNFGGTTVTAGRRIQWDTTALNAGPSRAENVHLEVSLPEGASVIENTLTGFPNPGAIPGRCSTAPAGARRTKVLCDYGTLLSGQQGGVRFQVLIDPALPAGTQMSFDSIVTSDQFDPNTSNNVTSIQFDANNRADMGLDKTESGSPVSGTDILYTYHISNAGPSVAHDVTFRDNLPAGTSFVSAYVDHEGGTGGVPLACTINQPTNQVVCPLGTIPPTGATPIVIFVTVHIASNVPNGAALTNSADLVSDTPDPYAPGSTDSVTVNAIAIADIIVTKTSDADVYKSSGTVTYRIAVHNSGPSDAQGVVMTDNLPLIKQDRVIWLPGAPTCTKPAGGTLLTCNLGTIPNGGTKTVTVIVVYKGSRGWIDNTANVTTTTTDPDSGNNSSTRSVLIGTLPKP